MKFSCFLVFTTSLYFFCVVFAYVLFLYYANTDILQLDHFINWRQWHYLLEAMALNSRIKS